MATMRIFTTMQVVIPGILPYLEKLNPDLQDNLSYMLHCNSINNIVGLEIASTKFPSTLFWIDENFNISYDDVNTNKGLVLDIQKKINSLLKWLQ